VGTHNASPQLLGSIFDRELTGDLTTQRRNIVVGNVPSFGTAVYQINKISLTPTIPGSPFGNAFIDSGSGYIRHGAFASLNVIVPEVEPRLVKSFRSTQVTCCGVPERVINIVQCNKKDCAKTICADPCSAPITIDELLSKHKNESKTEGKNENSE
jgi:hypothetical protein